MAHDTNVTKGYSTYTNIPARQGDYDHHPKHSGNQYPVENKTIERVPASNFVGSPSKVEHLKENGHTPTMSGGPKYAPQKRDHYRTQICAPEPDYENSIQPFNPYIDTHGYPRPGYVKNGIYRGESNHFFVPKLIDERRYPSLSKPVKDHYSVTNTGSDIYNHEGWRYGVRPAPPEIVNQAGNLNSSSAPLPTKLAWVNWSWLGFGKIKD